MGTFYHGDCLFVLKHDIQPNSIDLIYLDPPFFTGNVQKGTAKWQPGAMEVSYEDSKRFWAEKADTMREKAPEWLRHLALKQPDFASYLYYMMERLYACYHVLKPTGSIYLHCDWRASHYLKMVLDEVFGYDQFRNEIIWDYGAKATQHKGHFQRKHDSILFYGKTDASYFKPITVEYAAATLRERATRYDSSDEQGTYRMTTRRAPDGSKYRAKVYLKKGVFATDVWTIPIINATAKERTGYPTQKPGALLERIIKASSKEGDVVLDPFCGCGTTVIVASKLNRQWIGVDIDTSPREQGKLPTAFQVIQNRSYALFGVANYVTRDLSEIQEMDGNTFEAWANEFYKATKPRPDKGVDGITPQGIPLQAKVYLIKYPVLSEFVTNAKLHPAVPKPIKEIIAISQTGFDDSARKRKFEIETADNIKVTLATPEILLTLPD
ncbi:MAG: site-specific DNA-methyltransferase [Chloroflexi bacterium]|nr:site-specific DNA-methyltransferase [Chloroflexota bacterium]